MANGVRTVCGFGLCRRDSDQLDSIDREAHDQSDKYEVERDLNGDKDSCRLNLGRYVAEPDRGEGGQ